MGRITTDKSKGRQINAARLLELCLDLHKLPDVPSGPEKNNGFSIRDYTTLLLLRMHSLG